VCMCDCGKGEEREAERTTESAARSSFSRAEEGEKKAYLEVESPSKSSVADLAEMLLLLDFSVGSNVGGGGRGKIVVGCDDGDGARGEVVLGSRVAERRLGDVVERVGRRRSEGPGEEREEESALAKKKSAT